MIYYLHWLKWSQQVEEEVSSIQGFKTTVSTQPFCLQLNFLPELILGFALLTPHLSQEVGLIKPHLAPLVISISSLGCHLSYYNVISIRGSCWQGSQQCDTVSRAALTKTYNSAWSHSCYILVPPSPLSCWFHGFILCLSLLALYLLLYSVWMTNMVAPELTNFISANFYFYHLTLMSSPSKQYFFIIS